MSDFSRRIVVLKFSATEIYYVENVTKGFQEVFCQEFQNFYFWNKESNFFLTAGLTCACFSEINGLIRVLQKKKEGVTVFPMKLLCLTSEQRQDIQESSAMS
jgi:hypothetical protein